MSYASYYPNVYQASFKTVNGSSIDNSISKVVSVIYNMVIENAEVLS